MSGSQSLPIWPRACCSGKQSRMEVWHENGVCIALWMTVHYCLSPRVNAVLLSQLTNAYLSIVSMPQKVLNKIYMPRSTIAQSYKSNSLEVIQIRENSNVASILSVFHPYNPLASRIIINYLEPAVIYVLPNNAFHTNSPDCHQRQKTERKMDWRAVTL